MQIVKMLISNNFTKDRYGYKIRRIILHTYGGGGRSLYNWFNRPTTQASAHYAVFKDGGVEQYVEDAHWAWQAGTVPSGGHPNNNWESIGIEHQDDDNPGDSVRTDALYESSAQLVALLCKRHGIPCKLLSKDQMWGDGIAPHNYYANKSCPGGLNMGRIIKRANEILNPPAPQPTPKAELVWEKLPNPVEYVFNKQPTNLWDFNKTSWDQFKDPVKQFNKGERITAYGKVINKTLNAVYLLTEYSFTKNITNGFNQVDLDLYVAPEPPKPDEIVYKVVTEEVTFESISEVEARAKYEELKGKLLEGKAIVLQKVNKTKQTFESLDSYEKPVTPKPDIIIYRINIQGGASEDLAELSKEAAVVEFNKRVTSLAEGSTMELLEINVTKGTESLVVTFTKPVTPRFNLIIFIINLIKKIWKKSGNS